MQERTVAEGKRAGSPAGARLSARVGGRALVPARFRVVECLAEGGMGRVLGAFDETSRQLIALKTPRTNAPIQIASLRCEVEALAALQVPGVVRLLSSGDVQGIPWLALEQLEGHTLRRELRALWGRTNRGGPRSRLADELPTLPGRPGARAACPPERCHQRPVAAAGRLARVAGIVDGLAAALDRVHERGFVHRDIKPENVFLPDGGPVTLIDFGLACRAGGGGDPRGQGQLSCVGTMPYAAPEQIVGDAVDARTDVYALGCVLYELLTGVRPFDGDSAEEVARRHLRADVTPPSTLVAELPWHLDDLLLSMLAKRPGERPATAGAAARRLALAARRAAGVTGASGDRREEAQEALGA